MLYDKTTGGFRDKFDDANPSIQGTRSALRLIRLLSGYSDIKWEKINISSLLNDYLEDNNASFKIKNFVLRHINEFDGGFTNFIDDKYSDIFSTNSANWILYQLDQEPSKKSIDQYKDFSKKICNIQDNNIIRCRPSIIDNSGYTLRATTQFIDLGSHMRELSNTNNSLHLPKEWKIYNKRVQQCVVRLYNSIRVDIDRINDEDIDSVVKIILNSLQKFEYKGGYCFFESRLLVPNILATY